MRARRPLLFPLLLLAASAAGADASEKINLRGTGTPYIAEPYKALSYLYPVTQVFRGVALAVPYTESSSGEGLLALRNGSMAWAAVDVPLSEQDLAEGVRLIPALAGGVAIVYNIRELRGSGYSLNVSQEALLGLFNGNITDVRDRRILSWNPYLASVLPANGTASTRLDVLYLSSTSSGEARILTAALSQISSEWNRTHGTVTHYGSLGILPASHGFSSDDLPGELLFRPYAVGFLDIGTANAFKLSTSKLQNAASLFVSPLPLHLAAAVNDFSNMVDKVPVYNSYVSMVNGRGLFSYPLVGPIYVAVRQHHPPSCSDAYELVRYLYWGYETPPQEAADVVMENGFVPISALFPIGMAVLDSLTCTNGIRILEQVKTDVANENADTKSKIFLISACIAAGLVLATAAGVWGWYAWQEKKRRRLLGTGESVAVALPGEATMKTQRELDEDLNRRAEARWTFEEKGRWWEDGDAAAVTTAVDPAIYQTRLVRSWTGGLRAVVGPVEYDQDLWTRGDAERLATEEPRSPFASRKTAEATASDLEKAPEKGADSTATGAGGSRAFVAQPIAVKHRKANSLMLSILFLAFRTLVDAITLSLNWYSFGSFPTGLTLSAVYGALVIVATVFFALNFFAAVLSAVYQRATSMDVPANSIEGLVRPVVWQIAYIKSEILRLRLVCAREILYRVALLVREVPLICVGIAILVEAKLTDTLALITLAGNCASFGMKARTLPSSWAELESYREMKALYSLLTANPRDRTGTTARSEGSDGTLHGHDPARRSSETALPPGGSLTDPPAHPAASGPPVVILPPPTHTRSEVHYRTLPAGNADDVRKRLDEIVASLALSIEDGTFDAASMRADSFAGATKGIPRRSSLPRSYRPS